MKKVYTGLKATKIDFGSHEIVTGSLPPGCFQIVANVVDQGGNVCQNPSETISYWYEGNNPGGWD